MTIPSVSGDPSYDTALAAGMVLAALVAASSLFVRAPYGRFGTARFGPSLHPKLGWILMELPAPLTFIYFFARGAQATQPVPLLFLALWCAHYANRGLLNPLLLRVREGAGMSWVVVAAGVVVTALHGYLNGAWIGDLGVALTDGWTQRPRFWAGLTLYLGSLAVNVHADATLRRLRAPGEGGYKIPHGGAFRWVSSPHYLAELTAWAGFWLATASPGGLFILAISAANLVPRALATHRWYRERFDDYPPARRALIPFVL